MWLQINTQHGDNMITLLLTLVSHFVNVPVTDMRETPSDSAKVVSQAIYSERVDLITENAEWAQIQTSDGYQGWVKKIALFQTDNFPTTPNALIAKVNRCAAHLYHVNDTEYGPIKTLPFESRLEVIDQFGDLHGRWLKVRGVAGTLGYIQRGDIDLKNSKLTLQEALEFSKRFLDLPYTWGGRSSFGYDCSGFVQMVYRQMGIALPRDSKDQLKWEGFQEVALDSLQPGDLIFFGPAAPKVTHVVLYLGKDNFIHTSTKENKPYLRISHLVDPDWNGTGSLKFRTARRLKLEFRTTL